MGLVRGLADGGGGDETSVGQGNVVGAEEAVEVAEGVECAELGSGGHGGGGGKVAAEDDGVLEAVDREEATGGGVGTGDEEFEGVGAEVGGGEEAVGGGSGEG